MERRNGSEWGSRKFSSAKLAPYMDFPPIPV